MSESDPSNPAGGNTDDLLAQLAGEEVDRLLAEADVSQTATPEVVDHVDEQEVAALTSMLEESARKELEQIDRGEIAAPQAPTSEQPKTEAGEQEDVSAQLDQLFAALTTSKKEQEPEPLRVPEPVVPIPTEAENTAVAVDEKAALNEGGESSERAAPGEPALAWWARPLAWINMPFAAISNKTREKMGWIGIQTIVFALLILAYVWWLRGKK